MEYGQRQNPPSMGGRRPTQPKSTIPAKRSAADAAEDAWVADEDRFVLKQAKKKAVIRVRKGKAEPIDQLAVTLRALDATRNGYDSDDDDMELPMVDPEGIFEGLDSEQLQKLDKGIETYLDLEHSRSNREFWNSMKLICKDRRLYVEGDSAGVRGLSAVSPDLDKLLSPKTFDQLEALERQVKQKLRSNEAIDVDYWENLLKSISIYKAKARLRQIAHTAIESRLETLRKQQEQEALALQQRLQARLGAVAGVSSENTDSAGQMTVAGVTSIDPEPLLRLSDQDKTLPSMDGADFASDLVRDRRRVLKLRYIPARQGLLIHNPATGAIMTLRNDDDTNATGSIKDSDVTHDPNDNEQPFEAEEDLAFPTPVWADKYPPRKPRYFNRILMGYEWNKYNQTHYDHDNPPPKVVQGYKFNIFYPDLIDKTKAPTFKIVREGGRRRGQSSGEAGGDDTCIIRFIAGPPYQDIAFRIVDREWDYSAKRDRGFISSFDKDILQLYFQFKKVYYRK